MAWKGKRVSLNTKVAVFRVAVLPCQLYASEIWSPLLHRCLRRILDVSRWDRIRNSDLCAQCGSRPSIQRFLCCAPLRWLGHLGRFDLGRVCKRMRMRIAGCVHAYKRPRQGHRKWWNDLAQKELDKVQRGRARLPQVSQLRSVCRS